MKSQEDHPSSSPPQLPLFERCLLQLTRLAALLPKTHIPLTWLRELAIAETPMIESNLDMWEVLVRQLEANGVLKAPTDAKSSVRTAGHAVVDALSSLPKSEVQEWRQRLRTFCSAVLENDRAADERLINSVLTGDPDKKVTAWTVPSLELVRERALGNTQVEVVEFGDGTYLVRRSGEDWQKDCLRAFVMHEFVGQDSAGILWALRTKLLSSSQLLSAENRVGSGHLHDSNDRDAAMAAGLYWLNRADRSYAEGGGCGTSRSYCGKAIEILSELHNRIPHDPAIRDLLAKAKQAEWAYDD